jgi:cysteine-rich repeat protein
MTIHAWTLGVALLVCCSLARGMDPICGNGVVERAEECDDANEMPGDGCTENCTAESHYQCTHNSTSSPSQCTLVLLDLSSDNHTTLDRTTEFFDINTPVFLVDPNTLEFLVYTWNWTHLDIVILQGEGMSISESVGLDYMGNPDAPSPYQQNLRESDYPSGINGRFFVGGVRIAIDASIQASVLAEDQLQTVLEAAIYQAHEIPSDYLPRYVCLVAQDPTMETTACVTLYYIGSNINRPTVSYEAGGDVAVYVEGQSEPLAFVTGNITVTDDDHPTRYLMESASVSVVGFTPGSPEWLSLDTDFTLPDPLNASFDTMTGTLTISGNATTEVYSQVLQQLTYLNNMTQPPAMREIELTVSDGIHSSNPPVIIQIDIMNTNDDPSVSLDGESPVVTSLNSTYTEGSGAVAVVDNIHVIDIDPVPVITRALVVLSNPVDDDQEVLAVTDTRGLVLNVSNPPHRLELSGAGSPAVYTAALRSLTYHHLSANPGNPSPLTRLINFIVEDSYSSTSSPSTLMLEIVPVNDAPSLSFLGGGNTEQYSYTEDDPAINIGVNLTLTDVDDISIQSVSLYLTGLLDGERDSVGYNSSLVAASAISVTTTSNGTSRQITFSGTAPYSVYTEILRSLTYTNLYTNDTVSDGVRTISISATDTGGLQSTNTLTILVDVDRRNDGPAVDLGAGNDQGFTVNYVEGEPSVAIGISHLISISDEEGDAVSSMEVELVATNGPLDDGDTLFLRTPVALPVISHPNTTITRTSISASYLDSNSDYVDTLRALRYINTEDEPTLFVNDGVRFYREIVIRITDSVLPVPTTNVVRVTVEIEPINDKTPRIIINSEPMCTQDARDSEMTTTTVFRRSVGAPTPSHRRRRRNNAHLKNTNTLAAPQVLGVHTELTEIDGDSGPCLFQMVVQFNTDTSVPVVEIQEGLDSLLTFAPASLAKTPHRGYWRDYKTLVVLFTECVPWERDERKPLYLVFYGSEGSCTWDSSCDNGVCYNNRTGCPVAGYHRVNTSSNEGSSPTSDSVENCTAQYYGPDRVSVLLLSSVLLVAVVTVAGCQCRKTVKRRCGTKESQQKKTKPAVPTYVIEIQAPISQRPSQSPASAAECKKTGVQKDGHCPPPYIESCAATLTSAAVSVVHKPEGPAPSGMKNIDESSLTGEQCEGALDENKCLRSERGQVSPPIDTGGGTKESGGEEEGQSTQGNSAPPREQSRNTYSDKYSNSSTHNPH